MTVTPVGASSKAVRAALDDEGRFEVRVTPGAYRIALDAPDHGGVERTTVVSDQLRVTGRMRGSARLEAAGAKPPPALRWTGESPTTIAVREFHARWFPPASDLVHRAGEARTDASALDALRLQTRELATQAHAMVDAQADRRTRGLLRAEHMAMFHAVRARAKEDPTRLRHDLAADVAELVEEAAPDDPHFALVLQFLNLPQAIAMARAGADPTVAAQVDRWSEQQARTHPVAFVAAGALGRLMFEAKQRGDATRVAELQAWAAEPRFADTELQREHPPRAAQRDR